MAAMKRVQKVLSGTEDLAKQRRVVAKEARAGYREDSAIERVPLAMVLRDSPPAVELTLVIDRVTRRCVGWHFAGGPHAD